ncbi:MAG: hypothetical protein E6K68_01715 [Nitrospirae bacterium]|nr:MAG: hypothetical protein E6K68_01715 [Nitrospirota bacterium]
MTSTERGCTRAARAVSASFAWLLCGTLGPPTTADAHHTKPHQEAVQAARSALFDRKDPSLALRHLEGLWADSPTDSETPYLLGLAHFLLYDPDRALSMFDACLSRESLDKRVAHQRLECLYWSARASSLKAALAWYHRTSILDGVIKSRRAIRIALDLYEQVLAQEPGHVGALLGQAEYYMAAPYLPPLAYGDVDKARSFVARALSLERDNLRARYLQARLELYYNGRRDLARSGFATVRQLLDRGAGGAEAVLLRRWVDFAQAEVAFLDQDFPAAIAYTDAYLSQVPDGAEGYALKGASLKFLGRPEAGEALINKARELNPHVRRYREP